MSATVFRCVLAKWAEEEFPNRKKVYEGRFNANQIKKLNTNCYHVYFLPNSPTHYTPNRPIAGSDIDKFHYVFVDMDLKLGDYTSKEAFLEVLRELPPTRINDSGNGIHAYWKVRELDAISFLRFQKRLANTFSTDPAVCKIFQLLRVPNTINYKWRDKLALCQTLQYDKTLIYEPEKLDKFLITLSQGDEDFCQQHLAKTYHQQIASKSSTWNNNAIVKGGICPPPEKFQELLKSNSEVHSLFSNTESKDRSRADFRLAHILFEHGFERDEAITVLTQTEKAKERLPIHQYNYALNMVDKIWNDKSSTWNIAQTPVATSNDDILDLSKSVSELLAANPDDREKGQRFPCWEYLDATHHGFRLGEIIGLIAGSGVGKTAIALNMFRGFVKKNPEHHHFFVALEQPAHEIAERWRLICADEPELHDKVHVIDNYDAKGNFRHLSLDVIQDYLLKFKAITGKKLGCVVIDHINALKKKTKDETAGIIEICQAMKPFAVQTNTLLIMQSQTTRSKAGIGDLELNKDAAYGTVYFESYCDYLITLWQPLKRCYSEPGCPIVTAFKFCKIRHKKLGLDRVVEDLPYKLAFDPMTERLRYLTLQEEELFKTYNSMATQLRAKDRETDIVNYSTINWTTNRNDI